jgi:hypothetical protein
MERQFHLCLSPDALEADASLLDTVKEAGVHKVWLAGFLYGYWHYPIEQLVRWREQILRRGMSVGIINVPLGHPGDSLGAMHGNVPLTPPTHWKMGVRPDGSMYAGTSLHPPACEENQQALRLLAQHGFREVFLDDDFRLAQSPGIVGGCFCDRHREQFLRRYGYSGAHWEELLHAVQNRILTPVLRHWCHFHCDELRDCFRALQQAALGLQLGIMVMFMGAEKAGVRLSDHSKVPFRVGEGMFDDGSFGNVKGKTNELFSVLFHRRFVRRNWLTARPPPILQIASQRAIWQPSWLSPRWQMFVTPCSCPVYPHSRVATGRLWHPPCASRHACTSSSLDSA